MHLLINEIGREVFRNENGFLTIREDGKVLFSFTASNRPVESMFWPGDLEDFIFVAGHLFSRPGSYMMDKKAAAEVYEQLRKEL